MYEFLKEIGLALVDQGPAFFILSVVLGGIGYALHKGAQWWSGKAELWMTRWLNQVDKSQEQVDKLIDENRNDRMLYLESMKKRLSYLLKLHEDAKSNFDLDLLSEVEMGKIKNLKDI